MACQDPIVPCSPADPCSEVCADNLGTNCITASSDISTPINVVAGTDLTVILNKINTLLQSVNPAQYQNFNYGCFSFQGIETEQQFVEFIVNNVLCPILGSQTPSTITSLSQLNTAIQVLTTQGNGIINQATTGCYQTLAGVPNPVDLDSLLLSIQTILCQQNTDIQNLITNGSPPISVNNTNKSVQIATSGPLNHGLSAEVALQVDVNQAIVKNLDGTLFVPKETPIQFIPTTTINVGTSGTSQHTLQVSAKISSSGGNQLVDDGLGLFVPAVSLTETPITPVDSTTIDLGVSGVANHTLTAAVKINADPDNLIVATGTGIKVPAASVVTPQTPITGNDTNSIDLTVGGLNAHTISADLKLNSDPDNIAVITATGLKVPAPALTLDSGNFGFTLTNVTNVSASAGFSQYYTRIGNIVHVSGTMSVDPVALGPVEIGSTIPVFINPFTLAHQLTGVVVSASNGTPSGVIFADTVNNRAMITFPATDTTAQLITYQYTYTIIP